MRRLRVHANFAEYVQLGLILMALAELQGRQSWTLHLVGLALLVGRSAHAYGVSQEPERPAYRVIGMALTLGALIAGANANLSFPVGPSFAGWCRPGRPARYIHGVDDARRRAISDLQMEKTLTRGTPAERRTK